MISFSASNTNKLEIQSFKLEILSLYFESQTNFEFVNSSLNLEFANSKFGVCKLKLLSLETRSRKTDHEISCPRPYTGYSTSHRIKLYGNTYQRFPPLDGTHAQDRVKTCFCRTPQNLQKFAPNSLSFVSLVV